MLTIPEAAARCGRGPETIRRWVRGGRLPARREAGRLLVHAEDLDALVARPAHDAPVAWTRTAWGARQPDWVAELRRHRGGRRLPA